RAACSIAKTRVQPGCAVKRSISFSCCSRRCAPARADNKDNQRSLLQPRAIANPGRSSRAKFDSPVRKGQFGSNQSFLLYRKNGELGRVTERCVDVERENRGSPLSRLFGRRQL